MKHPENKLSFEQAVQFHQQGHLELAEKVCNAILKKFPVHAPAHHLLGVIAHQRNQFDLALQLMQQSIEENPKIASYYSNLGALLRENGDPVAAIPILRKAIELQPELADALFNLGSALSDVHQDTEAKEYFLKTIEIQSDYAKAHNGLGTILRDQFDFVGSLQHLQAALNIDPAYAFCYANTGATYFELRQLDKVVAYCQKAIELEPTLACAIELLGAACQELGQLEMSEGFMLRASALEPSNADYLWHLGLTRLALGKLEQGWIGYEYRLKKSTPVAHSEFPYPNWQGENGKDKCILVWGEQGIGDQIMNASMYGDLILHFRKCIFACATKLVPLYARSFPKAEIVSLDDKQKLADYDQIIDVQSAAGSLARWLRPNIASFPKNEFFLVPNGERVNYWKRRLAELGPELTVGICWRSSDMKGTRAFYCSKLDQWGTIFAVPGVRFINLQYDECSEELRAAKQLFDVDIHSFEEIDLYNDIDETAALSRALDLVISAPTAAGILAAANGVPTWWMTSGFLWQKLGTKEICWYRTLRTFEKSWVQEWEVVIDNVADELKKLVTAH